MRHLFILFLFLVANGSWVFGQQSERNKYPFDIKSLELLSGGKDSIIAVYTNNGFKYINSFTGDTVIKQSFEIAYPFYRGFALVKKDGKYGVLDKYGKFKVKAEFPNCEVHKSSCPEQIAISFNDTSYFSFWEGESSKQFPYREYDPARTSISRYKVGDKFGLKTQTQIIEKPIYDSVIYIGYSVIIVKKKTAIGVLDWKGKGLTDFEYESFLAFEDDCSDGQNLIYCLKKHQSWIYYQDKKKLFESRYRASNRSMLVKIDGMYNCLDETGNLIYPNNYPWISENTSIGVRGDGRVVLLKNKQEYIYY